MTTSAFVAQHRNDASHNAENAYKDVEAHHG